MGVNGAPNLAWVSDGTTGARMTEDEYRAQGYVPDFDSLPVQIVERVPVTGSPEMSPGDVASVLKTTGKKDA
jgi:hypothetical protein